MFDAVICRSIAWPLDAGGRWLAARGIAADHVTVAGCIFGLAAAIAIALGHFWTGLALFVLNRLADGLDGAVARATAPTDRGGFLDIVLDFFVYAAIPLAFAVYDPAQNALSAAILLASFLANGSAFLAFAAVAARKGLVSSPHGPKSIHYLSGLAEGAETIAFFAAFCVLPAAFPVLALIFAVICLISAGARLALGWKLLA